MLIYESIPKKIAGRGQKRIDSFWGNAHIPIRVCSYVSVLVLLTLNFIFFYPRAYATTMENISRWYFYRKCMYKLIKTDMNLKVADISLKIKIVFGAMFWKIDKTAG